MADDPFADPPVQLAQTKLQALGVRTVYSVVPVTRDVDVLPEGYRLENWGASCGVGYQGTVTCMTYGQHGFTISALYGELW